MDFIIIIMARATHTNRLKPTTYIQYAFSNLNCKSFTPPRNRPIVSNKLNQDTVAREYHAYEAINYTFEELVTPGNTIKVTNIAKNN